MATRLLNGLRFLIRLLLLPGLAAGQSPDLSVQKLSTQDGLLSNFVSGVTTDANGYLWVATRRGLCRYDGYTFQKIPENQPDGAVYSLTTLPNGLLAVFWGTTGLFIVNPDTKAMTPIDSVNFTDADPTNDHFENLFADSRGNVWSSSFGMVRRHDVQHRKRHQYPIQGSNQEGDATHFFEDRAHRLWILGKQGLYTFDYTHDSLRCVIGLNASAEALRHPYHFSAISEDKAGDLWLSSPNAGLVCYNTNIGITQHFPVSGVIQCMAFAADSSGAGSLWLGGTDGLRVFHLSSRTIVALPDLQKQGISVHQILVAANTATSWLATSNGLWLHRFGSLAIQAVRLPESIVRLPVVVTSILPGTTGDFWLGLSHMGVLHWNPKTNDFHRIAYPVEASTNTLSWVKGVVWAATSRGIFRLRNAGFQAVSLKTRFASNAIQKVLADQHGRLWVLHTTDGIQVFALNTLRPIHLWDEQKAHDLWATNQYRDLTESANGRIWIAAWYPKSFGMIWYNGREKRLQELADFNPHRLFIGDYFNRVSTGQTGRILFSGGGGINTTDATGKIDPNRSVYSKQIRGLADDFCLGVAEDTDGHFWIGTGEGLHMVSPSTRQVRHFTEVDGLLADDVTHGFLLTNQNQLLIGQQNGLSLIDIHRLHQPTPLPRLTVSSIQINELYQPTDTSRPIFLANDENNLRFTFTTLTFGPVSATHFRYKLTGKPNWLRLNTANALSLTNLKSGHYRLIVQNGDAAGHWNPNSVQIQFTIAPAWYETGWFRGLIVLALLAVLYGFYRLRIGQERRRSELTRQRAEAETRALRAQMNPHFIFNCMNTIDAYILTNRPDAASAFLQKFSRLIRHVLEHSRETLIQVGQELETLCLYIELEEERAEHRFGHTCTVDPKSLTCLMPPLLLQPFVENAILHGLRHKTDGPGQLSITIQPIANQLVCQVEDNGIGRTKAAQLNAPADSPGHQSLGSVVTAERVDSLQTLYGSATSYTIADQNPADGTGTVVTIKLPLLWSDRNP